MNDSKILISLLALLAAFTACGTAETNISETVSTIDSAPAINSEPTPAADITYIDWQDDNICAVAYLGYDYGDFVRQDPYMYMPQGTDYVTLDNSGLEMFLVIPRNADVTGEVLWLELAAESAEMEVVEQMLAVTDGQPFFLRCNVSDIIPDIEITLTSGDKTTTFSPYISLKDGSVVLGDYVQEITIPHN